MNFAEGFSVLQTINIFMGMIVVALYPVLSKAIGRKKVLYICFLLLGLGLAGF